jgi:hypothetical protein
MRLRTPSTLARTLTLTWRKLPLQRNTKWVRTAPVLVLLAAVALIAGCGGGGGSSKDARALIDKAFSQSITSADMTLNVEAKVNGVAQLQQPISLKVSGPFQSNGKGKLPSFNWQVSVSGGGQAFSGGLVSTGDNAFVNFQGTNYEVGADKVAQFNQQLGQNTQGRSLKDYGIDPQAWVKDPTEEGTESVNGVDTTHVKASVDIGRMFSDFNKTIQKAGSMSTAAPQQLSPDTIQKIQDVVKNPSFDIYIGKDDNKIRRLSVSVDFQIPSDQRAKFQGAEGGTLNFSIDFAKVGEPQKIAAPTNAHPLSELQQQLGGLGGGLGGLGGSGATPGAGGSGGGSGRSSGGNPSASQIQKYSKCLQSASPSDTAAIAKCSQLLKK